MTNNQIAQEVSADGFNYKSKVGKTQGKVLEALGITCADSFGHANAIFDRFGLSVSHRRKGREFIPVVTVTGGLRGGFNAEGEGDTYETDVIIGSIPQEWIA